MGSANTTITCILMGNINLVFLKSPGFANNENLLRGWLSIIMHTTGLGNDFIQWRDPLLLHLLRVAEKGNAMLTCVTCVLEAWSQLVKRHHLGEWWCFRSVCVHFITKTMANNALSISELSEFL